MPCVRFAWFTFGMNSGLPSLGHGDTTLILLFFRIAILKDLRWNMPNWPALKKTDSRIFLFSLRLLDSRVPDYCSLFPMIAQMDNIEQAQEADGAMVLVAANMGLFPNRLEIK